MRSRGGERVLRLVGARVSVVLLFQPQGSLSINLLVLKTDLLPQEIESRRILLLHFLKPSLKLPLPTLNRYKLGLEFITFLASSISL